MSLKFSQRGNFDSIDKFFKKASNSNYDRLFNDYGKIGVVALESATPINTGRLASSWGYVINKQPGRIEIIWTNSDVEDNVNVALLVQYGHGRQNGGYVRGIDYINPALKPVFDDLLEKVWKEVS